MDVHASDGGRVPVQSVDALSRFGVPHFESSIRGPGYDDVFLHLRRPHAACMADQCTQALSRLRGPNLAFG